MSNVDCPICMDPVGCSDCCTTACGHTFHSTCIFKNLTNSFACPMCRSELVEDEEGEEGEDEDDDEDGDEDDDEEYEPITGRFTSKQIHEVLKKKGFTTDDLLAFLFETTSSCLVTVTTAMERRSDELLDILDKIADNSIAVDHRDSRTYLQVVSGTKQTDEAGAGPQPQTQTQKIASTIVRV